VKWQFWGSKPPKASGVGRRFPRRPSPAAAGLKNFGQISVGADDQLRRSEIFIGIAVPVS
jgi:hypothetical protein